MFVLIWAVLLLSMRGLTDIEGKTKKQDCPINPSCITPDKVDITAEAGLCVVIPCTVQVGYGVESIIWHKCNKTFDRPIFKSDDNKTIQPEYKGRVSLLQSDLSKNNCSIIINDLTKSDSGLYYSTVTDSNNGCKTLSKKSINVTDPSQKPTMVIPPLTGGQKATLTCTAPGLCSGTHPDITWMWRGAGGKQSDIPRNITAVKTENLINGTTRHNSSLTFIPSAEHHNTSITCKVSYKGGSSTEETQTLNFTLTSSTTKTPKDQSPVTRKSAACNDTKETCTKVPDLLKAIFSTVQQQHGIAVLFIGFLLGMLPSAIIACLVIKCLRKKQRRFRSLPENMELVIAQSVPDLMDVGLAADYDVIRHRDAAEGGAEASGPSAPDGDARPKEVEYSNIDFSAMKRRNPAGAEQTPGTAETEYAEIKRGGATEEERPDDGGEDGGALGGNEEEMAVMIGEDEEAKQDMAAIEDGNKDAALYSNVNEVMDEV